MEIGVPGGGPEPEVRGGSGVGRAATWLLAAIGAAVAYLAAQVVGVTVVLVGQYASAAAAGSGTWWVLDDLTLASAAGTLLGLALAVAWWLYLRRRALLRKEVAVPVRPVRVALLACAILALGVALQIAISTALSLVLPLFPDVMAAYDELMDLVGVSGEADLLTCVETALFAPIAEEALCRGVILEFALRALCPGWRGRWARGADGATRAEVPPARFWAANVVQALIFAVMHLNVVQGSYAFLTGLLQGWLVWRTGRLRAAVLLHVAVNASAFLPLGLLPFGSLEAMLAAGTVSVVVLVLLAARLTRPEHEVPAFPPSA